MKKNEFILTVPRFKTWLIELKQRVRQSQINAPVKVNTQQLALYWQLGSDIVEKQRTAQCEYEFLYQRD